jgi:hypothetical protein
MVAALIVILASMAVPHVTTAMDRSEAWGAARYLWGQMALARAQAIRRSATVALRFEALDAGVTFSVFVDGNRNGVLTRDIRAGTDQLLEAPARLSEMFPGVVFSPGGTAPMSPGTSSLFSFTPIGTSTSGSVYVRGRDGSQFAVRVLGATARSRVLRYVPATGDWIESN